jgi:predicted HicB family RNase H-like nuclease
MINTMTIDGYDAVIQYDPDIKMFSGGVVRGL